MKKPIPAFATDDEAAEFIEAADLSDYDLSGFTPASFDIQGGAAEIHIRLPEPLYAAVMEAAQRQGVPYQRYIREVLERALGAGSKETS